MTRDQYVQICKTCKNQKFDTKRGIICGITQEIASFDVECENLEIDQQAVRTERAKNFEKTLDQDNQSNGKKDMIFGAMWCIGGIIATAAEIGYIFWGAIVFGGIQFFKGLANSGGQEIK